MNRIAMVKGRGMKLRTRQTLTAYLFLLIPLCFFLFIRIYPVFSAIDISLREWNVLSPEKPFVGFKNYAKLFRDKTFGKVVRNTAHYVIVCVPSGLVLSLLVALMLNTIKKATGLFRTLYFIPYITSAVAVSWIWRWLFMKSGGVVNNLLLALGMSPQPFLNSTSQAINVICGNIIWAGLGYKIIIFLAGLKQIPRDYYEAASIDGARPAQMFFKITIPLLNPTIVYLTVTTTIQMLQVFTQIKNITTQGTGGPLNSTSSVVLYIYQQAFQSFKMGYASAITVVLFLAILLITLFQMKVLNKRVEY